MIWKNTKSASNSNHNKLHKGNASIMLVVPKQPQPIDLSGKYCNE